MFLTRRALALALFPTAPLLAAACTSAATESADGGRSGGGSDGPIAVTSTDDECRLAATSAPAGAVTFAVTNDGGQVTEFYLLAADGVAVVGEVENIGPGVSRQLTVEVDPGRYVAACKPGMAGDGIRADFTVTEAGATATTVGAERAAQLATATAAYERFVQTEAAALADKTGQFAQLVIAGDDEAARTLYPDARTHWERIEPVAESFGDLDPRLDLREADLEPGQTWTGWHALEKELWPPAEGYAPLSPDQRRNLADKLVTDTDELVARVADLELTPSQLGNGAKELLDEVATGKVTGEEEIWSHTDLWDFQANVDGARAAFEALEPVVTAEDPDLAATLTERFEAIDAELGQHRTGDAFAFYDALDPAQVNRLAAAVDALSEPLSRLTVTVVA
ncbi:MAG: iron uptake system protein EfeO [Acidimicrobiales bacterium]